MSLTKSDLIKSISNECEVSKDQSTHALEYLLELIKSTLESGEDVLITGLGKFYVKDKDERRGRNPQTGEDKMLEARRVVTFRCSPILREKINGKN